jgi:hypothetical protein
VLLIVQSQYRYLVVSRIFQQSKMPMKICIFFTFISFKINMSLIQINSPTTETTAPTKGNVPQFENLCHSVWLDQQTGRPGFDLRQRQRVFPLAHVSRPALRPTQPPIQWVLLALSRELKAAVAWRWSLAPSSAEIKNEKELHFLYPLAPARR